MRACVRACVCACVCVCVCVLGRMVFVDTSFRFITFFIFIIFISSFIILISIVTFLNVHRQSETLLYFRSTSKGKTSKGI